MSPPSGARQSFVSSPPPTSSPGSEEVLRLIDGIVAVGCSQGCPVLVDMLLDFRCLAALLKTRPRDTVEAFLRIRPYLEKSDFLLAYRLRKELERQVEVVVHVGGESQTHPIDLRWTDFGRLLQHYRRQAFEIRTDATAFESIQVRFQSLV